MNLLHRILFLALLASSHTFAATQAYRAIDIGDLSGGENYSRAYGMNALGEIVGASSISYAPDAASAAQLQSDFSWTGLRGFVWSQGAISEVGTVTRLTGESLNFAITEPSSGAIATTITQTWTLDTRINGSARAIDDAGRIYLDSGNRGVLEFSLQPPNTISAQNFLAGSPEIAARTYSTLYGVNGSSANGIVSGFSTDGASIWSAQNGVRSLPEITNSGASPVYSVIGVPVTHANDVNTQGIAVGTSKGLPVWWDAQGTVHELSVFETNTPSAPFDPCAGQPDCHALIITNPMLHWRYGTATAINEAGSIVGTSSEGGFLWQNGEVTQLKQGGRIFNPSQINDRGDIVGSFSDGEVAIRLADGSYVALKDTTTAADGWNFAEAVAINNAGQVAINATRDGVMHAFLLSPIPEPASAWMFLAGLSILAAYRRQRGCK